RPDDVLFTSAFSPRAVLAFAKQPFWQAARACGESAKQASAKSAKARWVILVIVFMGLFPFISPEFPGGSLKTSATGSSRSDLVNSSIVRTSLSLAVNPAGRGSGGAPLIETPNGLDAIKDYAGTDDFA